MHFIFKIFIFNFSFLSIFYTSHIKNFSVHNNIKILFTFKKGVYMKKTNYIWIILVLLIIIGIIIYFYVSSNNNTETDNNTINNEVTPQRTSANTTTENIRNF